MISIEGVAIIAGFFVSLTWGALVVTEIAARKIAKRFGCVKIRNEEGETIYVPLDPHGNPVKVPVLEVGKDGKQTVSMVYAPLAYSMPVIAAMETRAYLTSAIQGKTGRFKQLAQQEMLQTLPMDQAMQAVAMEELSKGHYGKAIAAWIVPQVLQAVGRGNTGQGASETSIPRSGGRAI